MSLFQAILIGIMSCTAASTIACLGTTVGNYTLNRPLVASLFVGLILGDVQGCILIGIPMQVMWIALVTPGGTVASDLRAVSYIGIPLAYVGAKVAGIGFWWRRSLCISFKYLSNDWCNRYLHCSTEQQ